MFQNNLLMGAASASGAVPVISVANSALFNSANSERLTLTPTASDDDINTMSCWVYRAKFTGALQYFWAAGTSAMSLIGFTAAEELLVDKPGARVLTSTQLFRDIGWYHIVVGLDVTNAVATNRVTVEVNGVEITEWATDNRGSLSAGQMLWGDNISHGIGATAPGAAYFDGYIAEFTWIEATKYSASDFGEYDTTGLYWTPKSSTDIKGLTFGAEGFYLDNTTNAQTDASGNGNNWTNVNTVVTSTHTPTNTFSILNPLAQDGTNTLSNGNRNASQGADAGNVTTLAVDAEDTNGWYSEFTLTTTGTKESVGIFSADDTVTSALSSAGASTAQPGCYSFKSNDGLKYHNGVSGSYGSTWATNGKVLGIKLKSGELRFEIDGADQGVAYTGITGFYFMLCVHASGSGSSVWTVNSGQDDWEHDPGGSYKGVNTTNIAAATTRTASDTNKYFQTVLYEGNGAGQRVGAFQPFDNTFTVANSALLGATGYLNRTFDEAGNRQVFTLSTWFKISDVTGDRTFFASGNTGNESGWFKIRLNDADQLIISFWNDLIPTRVFKDASQWYHLILAFDTTQSTAADRIKVYINGVQETAFSTTNYPSQNNNMAWGINSVNHAIGQYDDGANNYWHGYFAQTAYIHGTQLAPSSLGEVDTSTNRWVPKDISGLTFGSAGFFLDYADSGNLGDDESGNTNDFTNRNSVVQTTGSPTTNFATLDPNNKGSGTLSYGNLRFATSTTWEGSKSTLGVMGGKWYCEMEAANGSSTDNQMWGIAAAADPVDQQIGYGANSYGYYGNAQKYHNNLGTSYGSTFATGDVIGCAFDLDNGAIWWSKNGTWQNSATIEEIAAGTTTNAAYTGINTSLFYYVALSCKNSGDAGIMNFGQLALNSGGNADDNGYGDFDYDVPAGFNALNQDNMVGTEQFQSAFSWIKNRDATDNHMLFDRVRGATKDIHSNDMVDEVTNANTVQKFLEAGVQVGSDDEVNTLNESYVLWNWMMEATGTGASNEDGSINTTSTLVDQTLGMSISTYVGTGSNATIGHGLDVKPGLILLKVLNIAGSAEWIVYAIGTTTGSALFLNNTNAQAASAGYFNNTQPNDSVFSVGTSTYNNASGKNHIAYCFRDSQFISIGNYEGNANANGAFVPTLNSLGVPIQPVWAITKSIDSTSSWDIYDKERLGYNPENAHLVSEATTVESTADNLDIVTGGLKMRIASDPNVAETYVYMAIGTPIIDVDGRIIAGR